jgi:hypothetical protein
LIIEDFFDFFLNYSIRSLLGTILSGFSFFADISKSAKSANLLFAESAKISKTAKRLL